MSLTVCLLGCGLWGRNILRDLISLDALVHVVDVDPRRRAEALSLGAVDVAEGPGGEQADGYIIATPASSHGRLIVDLLKTGKPVFVEKPLVIDPESANQILNSACDRIFVMDKWRYHPGVERMRCELASGLFGPPLSLITLRKQWSHRHADVGAHWTLLPHDLSIALHLFGEVPAFVTASPLVEGRPDLGARALFRTRNGVACHAEFNIASARYARSFQLICSKGALALEIAEDAKLTYRLGEVGDFEAAQGDLEFGQEPPLFLELEAFLKYLRGEGPAPMSSMMDARAVVHTIAEFQAFMSGSTVE